MPVILALVGALMSGVFLWIIWGNGMEVINHWLDQKAVKKNERRNALAIATARERAAAEPLRAITDPREAALVLMMRLAQARGEVTPEQRAAISRQAQDILGIEGALDQKLTLADYAARQAASTGTVVDVLSQLFSDRLDEAERRQLLGILDAVAAIHGGPTEKQTAMIARLTGKLALA